MHFSCHGDTNYEDPTQSTLFLTDWETRPLRVLELQRAHVTGGPLAYLSACFGDHGGVENMQDESLHLVSACQIAGFIGVVGSMWGAGADESSKVVDMFYKAMGEDFSPNAAAYALHAAVLGIQEASRSPGNNNRGAPYVWAPFIYFGV